MKKFSKTFLILTIGISVLAVLIIFINEIKIVNPYHPKFKPENFRFEDYTASSCIEKEALAKLFPKGTDMQFVDKILVNAGKAKKNISTHHENKINYFYSPKIWTDVFIGGPGSNWNIAVTYDDQNKVLDMKVPEGRGVSVYDFYQDCKLGSDYAWGWK